MKKTLILICLIAIGSVVSQAQDKTGYVNFGNVVSLMPEVETANQQLKDFRDSLISVHKQRMKAFQDKFARYQKKASAGEMSRVTMKEKEAELQKEQQEIRMNERKIQQQVQQKRSELMTPIVEKVQNAIDAVGDEGNYSMIFDTSLGAILFADDSEDLNDKVKARLNLSSE